MSNHKKQPFLFCESTGDRIPLTDDFTIGRSQRSDLLIEENNRVSREHGEIRRENDTFRYFDLNSANGSWINGKRLEPNQAQDLHHGSVIKVASRQFTFCAEDDPDLFDKTVLTRGGRLTELPNPPLESSDKDKSAIQASQQMGLKDQLNSIKNGDPDLINYVRNGIDQALDSPEQAVAQCRFIAQRAFALVVQRELPDGKIPHEWIMRWKNEPVHFNDSQIWDGKVPEQFGQLLALLRYMTGAKRVSPVARFISKETYFLLSSIHSVSLPAGHPEAGYFRQSSFALSKMNEAVTLCELLSEELMGHEEEGV
ncbi:FHA domain-containing protein [Akkermansiaceae bacterium]|nr:FHA domain-containing protein [Akkermansiaceae bacterium]MDA7651283.1 FHA domain-containing protein [Akkermansiaceae bacterium]MDB4325884.1 FHA domain-containing protein [Akkermansiaceae bacterium]MDB4611112.1 FHA domain-containing protein [Akkermansiaceae bacterium]MDB4688304.1 FHA domain-containing protein [Akkermansiaceae bacterium]